MTMMITTTNSTNSTDSTDMTDTTAPPATSPPSPAASTGERNAYDLLVERGFIYQCSDEAGLRRALSAGPVTFYVGFDPTARSLHVGHLLQIMAMAHLQRAGHRPIAVVGGGTAMIGDPTEKTTARPILSREEIDANAARFRQQLARFIKFSHQSLESPGGALLVDNAEWLLPLRYIDFLRDYGRYFSVNEMLRMETYRTRLETGLTFLEFNYALLQAYDFLELYRRTGCRLQIGGSDQWSNILAGVELIRRAEGGEAFALTLHLLLDASGQKMGKTATGGQLWLDAELTSPYDFYQFWINCDDADVARLLAYFTFLPMEEIRALTSVQGEALRPAKARLAFEVTRLVHGEEAARAAQHAARALFGSSTKQLGLTAGAFVVAPEDRAEPALAPGFASDVAGDMAEAMIPTVEIDTAALEQGIAAERLFVLAGLARSLGEARRLIEQGGAYLWGERIQAPDRTRPPRMVTAADLRDGALLLRAGKKRYRRIIAKRSRADWPG